MDYAKYYCLEDYLFTDVREAFHTRGHLTPEEFFAIVIWKAERAKSFIKRKLLKGGSNLVAAVKDLTSAIHKARSDDDRLRILLNDWEFALPTATAILTVLYPDCFTVYDVRTRDQLRIPDFAGRKDQIERYFNQFLPQVLAVAEATTLRDKDRYLWGKSSYESLQKFVRD